MKLPDFTGMLQEARMVNSTYALAAFGVIAVIAIVILLLGRLKITTFDASQTLLLIGMLLLALIILVIFGPRENKLPKTIKPTEKPIIPPILEPKVEFCDNREHVEKKITNLLEETKECLYYYGGAGFIGDYQPWQKELKKKLESEEIKFVRLIDLKSPEEMKEVLKMMNDVDEINEEVKTYITFLKTHSEYLKHSKKINDFYDFEGAPLWKNGIHHLIFDRKHVAIVFLIPGNINAIFLHNYPDIAGALVTSIIYIKDIFNLKRITSEELEEMSDQR